MSLIGLDQLPWQMPFPFQWFKGIRLEVEALCLPLGPLDVLNEPEGGRTIRDMRHMGRKALTVVAIVRQVAA